MPGTFNPVSSNPVAGVPHAKSFRTLLGFGSGNGGGSSTKPSFFSQLNLKAARKSFGGPTDCQNDHSVLIIDPKLDEGGTCQGAQNPHLCLGYLISDPKYASLQRTAWYSMTKQTQAGQDRSQ